jgi:tetraacyldisaccharide 4'-kinase
MPTIPPALAPIVYLPGLLYEALLRMRNRLYASELFSQGSLSQPVISIGNITLGGTGKTPFVIYTARVLSEMGFEVAVLSRGYGRRNPKKSIILMPEQTISTPEDILGDEPALIRRHLPQVWMGISKSRFLSGNAIAKQKSPMIFLLDDGFQHRKLHRNLDIVLIDPNQPLENNRVFPRGSLREPITELQRADLIVVNGFLDLQSSAEFEARLRRFGSCAPIFYCSQYIQNLIPFACWKNKETSSISFELPSSAYLVTAIGNPERFYKDICKTGINVYGMRSFRDHHRFVLKDWQDCVRNAEKSSAETMIVTEKDAIKITQPPEFPLQVAVQSTELRGPENFRQLLRNCIQEN